MENLLTNGDFEQAWANDHLCLVIRPDGSLSGVDIGNIFVPPGWRFWFYHDPGNFDQPEGRDAHKAMDPRRVYTGEQAYMYFSFFRKHKAGLLTRAHTAPGTRLVFSAYAHAWSNHLSSTQGGHPNDPAWSDGVGYTPGGIAIPYGEIPAQNGDPQNDAIGNFLFKVGIDPFGGANPLADSVIWGDEWAIYNGYCQELRVEATAMADLVTVFLYSHTLWKFQHNDAYWDNAKLTVLSPAPPPPEPIEPEPIYRGDPREEYVRTFMLLPPSADAGWAMEAINATWDRHRYTIGGSADDAGIGNLDERNVIAINPDEWDGDLLAFYEKYYPGVNVEAVYADNPAELFYHLQPALQGDPGNVWQRNPAWSGINLGGPAGVETIGSHGCVLCCIADLLRDVAQYNALPPDLNRFLHDFGVYYDDDNVDWAQVDDVFDCVKWVRKENRAYSAGELKALLDSGYKVIVAVNSGKHFVYLTDVDTDRIYCRDPWYEQEITIRGISQVYGVRVYRPAELTDDPIIKNTIRGVHDSPVLGPPASDSQEWWLDELTAMHISWLKTLSTDRAWLAHLIERGITPIVRLYQAEQFPGRLDASLMTQVPGLISAGVRHFEIANEPNLPCEWKSGWDVDYHDTSLVNRVAADWWDDAVQIIGQGGLVAFPAMAPTERGGSHPTFSSVHWALELISRLVIGHRVEMADYLRTGKIWVALHLSPFNRPFDYEPAHATGVDDMCLRGYEYLYEAFRNAFGVYPMMISTEGGCYSPEALASMDWEPYTEEEWAERQVAMFDYLQQHTPLAAMCPWILSDRDCADPRWRNQGWYRGREPRPIVMSMKSGG